MAKVTDLNGCFVRVNGDVELIKSLIKSANPSMTTGSLANPRAESVYFRGRASGPIADFVRISPQLEFKEIYFHNGEFYDKSLPVVDFLNSNLKFIEGDLYINSAGRVFEVSANGHNPAHLCNNPQSYDDDTCVLYSAWMASAEAETLLNEIPWTDGYIGEKEVEWVNGDSCVSSTGFHYTFIGKCNKSGFDCILLSDEGTPTFGFIKELSKPETETEKKTREIAEEVDRICFDLFGTPAFDCNQDIIDTVEKFVVNGYKKAE